MRLSRFSRLIAPLALLLGAVLLAQETKSLEGFDAVVSQAMKDWKIPGAAVAVVQDGKVILSKGYGQRDIKKGLPVTPQTLFAIGSITKSFTVLALGMLVDEGKLDWDKPVREYLPAFKLYDAVATERMTPRDLVTHRSGLPRHDLLWYNSSFTRKDMVDRLRYLEPSKDFRTTYQYNNLMFMTAGYIAGELAGMKWEGLVRKRIFEPLGMKSSNFSVADSQKSADFALPYQKVKEELKEIPFRGIDEVGPAGSINSNLEDMSRYLLLHMSKGKLGQTQLVSENNIAQMHTPQMVTPGGLPRWTELGHSSYGMAWLITTYRGYKSVGHGGAIDGFNALITFLPQKNIGVVALVNRGGTPVPQLVTYNAFDRLLGLDPVPWAERYLKDRTAGEASEEEAKKRGLTTKKEGTRPSHDLKDYAGRYEHPGYGVVRIDQGNDGLKLTFNRMSGPLKHFHYDIFEVAEDPLNPLQQMKVSFATNLEGEIGSLAAPLEPAVKEIVFTKKVELPRSVLEGLTGQYELAGQILRVSLKEDKGLVLLTPGQGEMELVPVRGLLFSVKGLTGFSVEFKPDASGRAAEMIFYQRGGTVVIKRKPE